MFFHVTVASSPKCLTIRPSRSLPSLGPPASCAVMRPLNSYVGTHVISHSIRPTMTTSRRKLLQAIAALPAATIYTRSAFSCTAAKDRYDHAKLPTSDFLSNNSEDGIEQFLDEKYGRDKWTYSTSAIAFRTTQVSENSGNIPIEICSCDPALVERYRTLSIFVQRFVNVAKSGKVDCGPDCWSKRSMISRVAEFKLSKDIFPDFSIRIQNPDSRALKLIAVFTPISEKAYPEVVKQNGSIKLARCFLEIDAYVL